MKVVKVYGALAKRLGQTRFEFDVNTPSEAIKALLANFPGLEKWLINSAKDGIGYRVKVGKENVGEKNLGDLGLPWSERDVFSITPVLSGAITWREAMPIIAGALLITAAVMFAPAAGGGFLGASGAGGLSAGMSTSLGSIGLSMVTTGIVNILSPPPGPLDMKQASNLENFSFSGIVNTSQVGTPIPIAYGRLFVGSSVVSSGLDVDQLL